MLFKNKIPTGFKILSEFPALTIEYHERLALYPIKIFFMGLLTLLIIPIFIICCWLFIQSLVDVIPDKIVQTDFWQAIQKSSIDELRSSLPSFLLLVGAHYLMGIIISIFIIYEIVWSVFGITEYRAFPDKLIVKYELFKIYRTNLVLRNSLLYFKQHHIESKGSISGWKLEAITNRRRFFFFPSRIVIVYKQPYKHSAWLGRVLADFYQVEFLPSPKAGL